MCCNCCCCCFDEEKPIAISGIVINVIVIGFFIWGIAELVWGTKGAKALYNVSFVFLILTLLGFIGVLILLLLRKDENSRLLNKILMYISIAIIVLLGLGLVFLIIPEIITLKDYIKAEDALDDLGSDAHLPTDWWLALLIPGIINIILISTLLCVSSRLTNIFSENNKKFNQENQNQNPNGNSYLGQTVQIINPLQTQTNPLQAQTNQIGVNNQITPGGNPNMNQGTPANNLVTQKGLV